MSLPIAFDDFRGSAQVGTDAARAAAAPEAIPHVVAWNLTRRCNLACAHCYIAAGPWQQQGDELSLNECERIAAEILELNPAPLFILSGGEPLLREDLEEFASFATGRGATVVVGTNGTGLTEERIASLQDAGVTGFALSVDSLDARYHDRFRHGEHALEGTMLAIERLRQAELDFVIQTAVTPGNRADIPELVEWSAEQGAVCFNLYFLVETGRGVGMRALSPEENEGVLEELVELGRRYRGRMMVRSKCQPAIMRHVHRGDPDSPLMGYATRCPCGVQYARITPEGKLTPCPYMPAVAGDLRTHGFAEIWKNSSLLHDLRQGELGGKCGRCEYRALCGGCRARAYAHTGDPLEADLACAYEPGEERQPIIAPPSQAKYGDESSPGMVWTPEARKRLERIPSFVRGVVSGRVERWAEDQGITEIRSKHLEQLRRDMPVDFSRRLPHFARDED